MTDASARAGRDFVEAVMAKDDDALDAVIADTVDFRGLTPGRAWQAGTREEFRSVLWQWFEPTDSLAELLRIDTGTVADRHSVTYRLRGRNPDGGFVVEQHAYFTLDADGRIAWLRVVCSGFRPDPAS